VSGADLVLKNGVILSVTLGGKRINGTAVAVKGGLIVKVGTDEDMAEYISGNTKVVDCRGNTIMPGMCDAHCHPAIASSLYVGCNLFGIYIQEGQTPQEITDLYMQRLADYVKAHKDDDIIRGIGWVKTNYTDSTMPTRHDIDRICSDKPVVLESFCQHNLWVNTRALELAALDENCPDPVAGTIYREADGYPAGVFSEPEAMELIKQRVPGYDFTPEKYTESFKIYQRQDANRYGITMVQDCMYSDNAREAYKTLACNGDLTVRVRGVYLVSPADHENEMVKYTATKGVDNVGEDFRIDTIKIFTEGSDFAFLEPYTDSFIEECGLEPGYKGSGYWNDDVLTATIEKALEAGFDLHIHAMGDASVKQAVNCLARAQKNTGVKKRNVIAHLMLVDEEDARTMGEAGIMANCQPRWMVYDSDINAMVSLIGEERARKCYPYRVFLQNGVRVAFGTDFPVTPPPNPFHEIQCAMTRSVFPEAPDYEQYRGKILGDEKAASLEEAIQSITINGAYQMNMDGYTGSIEEGKSADLVILDSNMEAIPVEHIYQVNVSKTIFKGKVVYEKAD